MDPMSPPDPAEALGPEDQKLVSLARSARARIGAARAGAVRDDTGRSYVGADVHLPSLTISGLDLAVAQAVAAGATGLEAAVVVGDVAAADPDGDAPIGVGAVGDVGPQGVPIFLTDRAGAVVRVLTA